MSKRFLLLVAAMILCMSVFVGCSGDDGKDGVVDQGTLDKIAELEAIINGDPDAPEVPGLLEQIELLKQQLAAQAGANIVKEETCSTCHAVYDLHHNKYLHGSQGLVAATNTWRGEITDITIAGDVATVAFNVKTTAGAAVTTGVTAPAFRVFQYTDTPAGTAAVDGWARFTSNPTVAGLTHVGNGEYTVTVTSAGTDFSAAADGTIWLFSLQESVSPNGFNVLKLFKKGTGAADFTDATVNPRLYVSDDTDSPSCARCHGDNEFHYHHNNVTRATGDSCVGCHNGQHNKTLADWGPGGSNSNSSYVALAHSVHSGHDVGGYYFESYSAGIPTSSSDCALCHTTPEQQELIYSEKNFRIEICATCHGGGNPFDTMTFGHTAAYQYEAHKANYTTTYNDCSVCHGDGAGWEYVRNNLHKYFDSVNASGVYTYTDLNKSWKHEYVIDDITVEGRTVTVDWYVQEKDGGAKIDVLADNPEYAFVRTGSYAPGFTVGYATGDDWTNEGVGNNNAQPQSVSFSASNVTAVGGNVFRTTFTIPAGVDTTIEGRKGIVALRGVPTTTTKLNANDNGNVAYAYIDTVTREFSLTDGSIPANLRRVTATFEGQCKSCHDHLVGHGHSYVNNIDVCMVCHNPSATDKGSRLALTPSYDANNSADGKDEESFDLRYMLHRIHSVGANDNDPYFVYRTRGIYGFYADDADGAAFPDHVGNKIKVSYPRAVTACGACHDFTQGFHGEASLKAAPLTLKQGDDLTTEGDDTVLSPHAGACVSCHPANQGHAATQSYYVTLIKNIFTKLSIVNK